MHQDSKIKPYLLSIENFKCLPLLWIDLNSLFSFQNLTCNNTFGPTVLESWCMLSIFNFLYSVVVFIIPFGMITKEFYTWERYPIPRWGSPFPIGDGDGIAILIPIGYGDGYWDSGMGMGNIIPNIPRPIAIPKEKKSWNAVNRIYRSINQEKKGYKKTQISYNMMSYTLPIKI